MNFLANSAFVKIQVQMFHTPLINSVVCGINLESSHTPINVRI